MIIGFTGYAQSGKDTAADYLAEEWDFNKVAFADGVRYVAELINPIVGWIETASGHVHVYRYLEAIEEFSYEGAKETFPEVRRLLQVIGTEVGREWFNEAVWINDAFNRLERPCVISDVRFPNEAVRIWQEGGYVVKLSRHENNDDHPSEASVDEIEEDYLIDNTGSLDDLYGEVGDVLFDIWEKEQWGQLEEELEESF